MTTSSPTVLIIDDAVHIRRLIIRMLELAGFDTLEAADGLQGIDLLATQKPDIVTFLQFKASHTDNYNSI